MQIRFHCPTDKCVAIIEYEPLAGCSDTIKCPRCSVEHAIDVTESMTDGDTVDRCAACDCRELFIRKDFPQFIGVLIVVGFGLAAIYYFTISVLIAWSILAAAVVVDVAIYLVIGKVTTCYACRAQYRKCKLNPDHEGFDLATSEKY